MENNLNPNEQQDLPVGNGFVKKTIEQPIMDTEVREKISGVGPAQNGSLEKSFFQANKIYFWAIGLGVVTIGLLAYFAFKPSPTTQPKEANIELSVEVKQDNIASGDDVTYYFNVANRDSQKLIGVELELIYPSGVQYVNSVPPSEVSSGSVFKVPDLVSGQNANLIIKTKVTGGISDEKNLKAKLHYKFANFNSEFIKETEYKITLAGCNLTLELSGPSMVNNAQLVVYELRYKNESSQEIKNARAVMQFAEGFDFASATPMPDIGSNTWSLPAVAAGGEGRISVQGSFRSSAAGQGKTTQLDFKILDQSGNYGTCGTTKFTSSITSLPLLVFQELSTRYGSNVAAPGDSLEYKVKFQNNSNTSATGVNIIATINSKVLDLQTLQSEGGTVNGNTIMWNAASVPTLESLGPNEAGEVTFRVKIKNPAVKDSSKELTVISSVKIKANEYEAYFPGDDLTVKISSPIAMTAAVDFASGELPPKVGKPTQFKINIALVNSSNDFKDGLFTAFLPGGANVYVSGSVIASEANNFQFDSATGKITWKVGKLDAYTGKFSEARALEFEVKLQPSLSQVGSSPVLIKDMIFTAEDTFTGLPGQLKAEALSTSDLQNQDGYSKGRVVK